MAKILLVEDDTNLSEIYQARMEAEGYTVVGAPDGESALALAAKEKPDLIISDVMMPKISGFEMLDILRNTDGLKHTRVIMLTALGQAEDRTRAESLGADKYLVKSQVTLEDIVAAAQELLGENDQPLPTPAEMAAPTVTAAPASEPAPEAAAPTGPLAATTAATVASDVADDSTATVNDDANDVTTDDSAVGDDPVTDDSVSAASDTPLQPPVLPVAEPPVEEAANTDVVEEAPLPEQTVEEGSPPTADEPPAVVEDDSFPKVEASESADADTTATTEVAPLTEPLPAIDPTAEEESEGTVEPVDEAAPELAQEPVEENPVAPALSYEETPVAVATEPAITTEEPVAIEPVIQEPVTQEPVAEAPAELSEPVVETPAEAAEPEIPAITDAPAPEPTPALQTLAANEPAPEAAPIPEPTPELPVSAPEPVVSAPADPVTSDVPATAAAIDEKVVANAVDKLLAKSPSAASNDPAIAPGAAAAMPRKKIISPIEHPPMPTLQDLLAIEAAKDSGVAVAPVGAVTPAGGVSTDDASVAATLAQARAEAAKNPQPKEEEFDPNSISL